MQLIKSLANSQSLITLILNKTYGLKYYFRGERIQELSIVSLAQRITQSVLS